MPTKLNIKYRNKQIQIFSKEELHYRIYTFTGRTKCNLADNKENKAKKEGTVVQKVIACLYVIIAG